MDPIEFDATLVIEEAKPNSGSYEIRGSEFSRYDNSLQVNSLTGTVESDSGDYWINLNVETAAGVFSVAHRCTECPFLYPFNDSLSEQAKGCDSIKMIILQSCRQEGSGYGRPDVYDAKALFVIK
jgi:hypothetical protein